MVAAFKDIYYNEPYHVIWAVSLSTVDLSANSLIPIILQKVLLYSFTQDKRLFNPFLLKNKYPTKIGFAENQLSLSLISLSPLSTTYPKILPHLWVEPSSINYQLSQE